MQLFTTAATTPLTDSSSLNPNASALLAPQAAYGFSDPLQQMRRASCNTSAKAGAYHADFDGNGMTDLLWYNNQTGDLRAWLMNGADAPTVAYYGTVALGSGWTLQGYGDFNGDGKTDLFWQNLNTGETSAWLMNGSDAPTRISYSTVTPGSGWVLQGMGDFTGTGKTDLFWYNKVTGDTVAWLMNGTNAPTYASYGKVAPESGWVFQGMGDFSGDGKTDLFWYNRHTGDTGAWLLNGANAPSYATYGQVAPNSGWILKGMGDLTGNGKTDLFWYNQQTGDTAAWILDGTSCSAQMSLRTLSPQNGWNFEGLADVTGNGKADAIWYNKRTGETQTWMMNGTSTLDCVLQQQNTSSYWDLQAMGDFTGKGKMDLFWRDYGMFSDKTQVWSMNSHNSYSTQSAGTATAGWQVVAMDQMTGRYLG
ncbi:MAG: hypothetical protein OHK0047_20970 [Leptolyngbyaceae cyanobacterium]